MQHQNLISNLSIFCNFPNGFQSLRDFILTQAISGTFSEIKPESWRQTTLGKEVEIIRGITFPSSAKFREPANERIVCLRTTNIQEQVDWEDLLYVPESYVSNSGQYIRKNDILISMANSRELVGKVSLVTRDDVRCTLGGFISAIRCSETILPEFLMIILRAPATREKIIDSSTQTTNIANISLGRLRPLEISLPSISEQLNIIQKVTQLLKQCDEIETTFSRHKEIGTAARRSAIDAISTAESLEELQIAWERIKNNWDLIANTPASIESLRGLILDLAVTGRLTRSSSRPNQRVTRDMALSETPWGLFAPKDWNLTTLGDACSKISDGTHKTPRYQEYGVPFLSIKDISSGMIDFSKTRFISQSEHDELCKRIKPSRGDVLFCRIGTLGKAITIETDREFSIFVSLGLLRPKHHLNPKFLELSLNSPISHKQFESIKAGGSHTQKLNLGAMSKYIIWYPDPATQSEIVQQVSDLMTLCDQLELKMKLMESLSEKFAQSVVFSTT